MAANKAAFDYLAITPPSEITSFQKQTAKRHFGVHGYFTKQVWRVVQHYIKTFTQPGDTVLDPFGGSGVTLVEALMLGRKAIHIDVNPLSDFIVKNLIQPIDLAALTESYHHVDAQFRKNAPKTKEQIEKALKEYPYPKGVRLPANSDVPTIELLFSPKQLAQLAYLKHLILKERDVQCFAVRGRTVSEPEPLAADMRSRAGHYEVLGETYAKFEFFEKGWNPYGKHIRYIYEIGEWMVWSRGGWRQDTNGKLMRMTKSVIGELVDEAGKDKERWAHAKKSASVLGRKAMIASASVEKGIITDISEWDRDGWLFNCQNGVIELKTQRFRKRTQEDLCTKQSPVTFDPDATCPLWEAAMEKWCSGDKELVEYLQTAWGVIRAAIPVSLAALSVPGSPSFALPIRDLILMRVAAFCGAVVSLIRCP